MPTTMTTFAQVCWLCRASVVATARSRTKRTASVAPAASGGMSRAARAWARAARACASAWADCSAGTCSELSIHSSVMGGAITPGPSTGSEAALTGTRTVAHPNAKIVSSATRRIGTWEFDGNGRDPRARKAPCLPRTIRCSSRPPRSLAGRNPPPSPGRHEAGDSGLGIEGEEKRDSLDGPLLVLALPVEERADLQIDDLVLLSDRGV